MQAVTRVAAVLEALAESGGDQSLAALSSSTALPKTTVHRICCALEQVGYVRVDAATVQRGLGPALLRLAAIGRRDLRAVLEPYLERLSRPQRDRRPRRARRLEGAVHRAARRSTA